MNHHHDEPAITLDNYEDFLTRYHKLMAKAVHHAYRICGRTIGLDDLWQEARIALFHAIMKFDPSRGVYFWVYLQKLVRNRTLLLIRDYLPHHYKKNAEGGYDRIRITVDSFDQKYDYWRDEL